METCEGFLLIPPDRGQILGRAIWKPRYVVVGGRNVHREGVTSPTFSPTSSAGRANGNGAAPPKIQPRPIAIDDYHITIFKSKVRINTTEFSGQNLSLSNLQDDWEPSYQYPVSSVIDCQVQMLAHRKQGPVLPTLVITINDKEKKRRSSRAAGLMSSKESSATTLWFRTPPDDHHISLHEWARFIVSRKLPMSPEDSPASPSFTNPFSPQQQRSRDASDYFHRPPSGKSNPRTTLQHKPSTQTYSSRERPVTFSSDSPSLRSKRSDVSSPTSMHHPAGMGFAMPDPNKYTTVLPSDIPSPITTMSDYQQSEFIEGWTAAQGRSSTVSSPIRGRGSVSSGGPQPFPGADSSSPPAPRETILDRAFQLRCIPGSEREVPGEEKLTSLARFDALMREADAKRRQQVKAAEAERAALQSAFDMDEDSSEEDQDSDDDEDEETDDFAHEADVNGNRHTLIAPNAQRALEFLSSRPDNPMSPRSPVMRSSPANFSVPLQAPTRPHTAHSRMRPSTTSRTYSQPQPVAQERLDVPTSSSGKISEESLSRANGEKRTSGSSAKRLSFTEFTKRLSSTSSLLLVQTNTSGGSSCGSSEFDPSPSQVPKGTLNARGVPPRPRDLEREEQERRCGWRNSVGFAEGGLI